MSDDSKLDNMAPLGKSVEEVEADTSNRVNPPAPADGGPARDDAATTPLLIGNASLGGLGSQGGLGGTFAAGFAPIGGVTTDPADPEESGDAQRANDDPSENSEA